MDKLSYNLHVVTTNFSYDYDNGSLVVEECFVNQNNSWKSFIRPVVFTLAILMHQDKFLSISFFFLEQIDNQFRVGIYIFFC